MLFVLSPKKGDCVVLSSFIQIKEKGDWSESEEKTGLNTATDFHACNSFCF